MLRVSAIQEAIGNLKDNLLFLHAVTGSDTTSVPYKHGRKKGYKVLKSNDQLKQTVTVLNRPQINPEDIAKAGEECLLSLKGASAFNSLDDFRLAAFKKKNTKESMNSIFQVVSLPSTSAAACQLFLHDLLSSSAMAGEQYKSNCMGMDSI